MKPQPVLEEKPNNYPKNNLKVEIVFVFFLLFPTIK